MTALVLREDAEGCATLTLNRPDALNALSIPLFRELRAHIDALAADQSVACVILTGAGRAFCAGYDVKGGRAQDHGLPIDFNVETVDALAALPMPVIAAVRGHCYTGGLEIALAADVIIAAETARFADTHAKFGLNARWGLNQRLPRRIGRAAAKLLSFTGKPVDAARAEAIGLVEMVVADDALEETARMVAGQILGNEAASVRRAKAVIDAGLDAPLAEAMRRDLETHPGRMADLARADKNGRAG